MLSSHASVSGRSLEPPHPTGVIYIIPREEIKVKYSLGIINNGLLGVI